MDVERVAALIQKDSGYAWRCPDHGDSCPGRPHLQSPSSITPCPEHGPKCKSKSCAKLLEQQYTWDATKRQWQDPNECRDTCMECCTEALYRILSRMRFVCMYATSVEKPVQLSLPKRLNKPFKHNQPSIHSHHHFLLS
jgi:hypothetical protein